MIDFLEELGNFKQKDFYTSKCKSFYILKQQNHCAVSIDLMKGDFFVQLPS